MQWLLLDFKHEDPTIQKFISVLDEKKLPYYGIEIVPFTHEITGLENIDLSKDTIFIGSCQMCQKVSNWNVKPGVWWKSEWWDPREWVKHRDDMLNQDPITILVKDLRNDWVKELTFIKSIKEKLLTGMVIEPIKEDHDYWTIEHSDLDGTDELITSPYIQIDNEWRFFIVDGEVITGSMYRRDGVRCRNFPIPDSVWDLAKEKAKQWLPTTNVVMDIAQTRNHGFKVIEFNSINASGVYSSDLNKLVTKIEQMYSN